MKKGIILILLLFPMVVFSQKNATNLVQVSGVINDADSSNVVPYVTIKNLSTGKTFSANYQGYFSVVASPRDSLLFSAVGYRSHKFILPSTIVDNKYTLYLKLKPAIVFLRAVRIYPWSNEAEFTAAFMSLKIANDDYAIAKKNLSQQSIMRMSQTLSRDAMETSGINFRFNQDRALNKNMVQSISLLNPFAWGRLFEEIKNGDKKREEKN